MRKDLEKGNLAGIIAIHPYKDSSQGNPRYFINIRSTTASGPPWFFFADITKSYLKIERGITGRPDEPFYSKA
jgi:hypothetical protein